ncbi:MAG: xanthine dehydrogenase family protein subunit M [Chitinophagaceae bacterium]|nr:xanthine dehydrogenase family protein subunit M [Chitinophagaceae bacterium]
MIQFEYVKPSTQKAAVNAVAKNANAQFIAGGTNLVDLMKRGVTAPQKLVDINGLPLKEIKKTPGHLYIGALALNSVVAGNNLVLQHQPLLAQALASGASPQLRNMATVGGNIMQRTRCSYFYDTVLPCNKREPGTGCSAIEGYNRMHAIFGSSLSCIAVHPSDMCVALATLEAVVMVSGPGGDRRIPFADFHRLPGETPHIDNNLQKGELIVAIEIPDNNLAKNIHYLKVRDRASYAFALVSVAAALQINNGTIEKARLAMGGVAHKPWRLFEAEKMLVGKEATMEHFKAAATLAMTGAKAFEHNTFKLKMAPNSIMEALRVAAGLEV